MYDHLVQDDGNSVAGAQGDQVDPLSFEMLSASLRTDAGDLHTFLDVLASKLSASLPGCVRIDRDRSRGILHRNEQGSVRKLTVTLGERELSLTREAQGVVAHIATIVRGITLKTEDQPVDVWVEQLAHALSEEAQRSMASHEALSRLVT